MLGLACKESGMRTVMMGTGTFAEPTFQALLKSRATVVGLVTQPERSGAKLRGSTRQTGTGMATLAREAGLPVLQPESINTPEGVGALAELHPDMLVVAAYGQILKPAVLAVPTRGAINVHASLLPKYRGASPVAAAIWHGETETGVTIIRITPGLDAGNILRQAAVPILPHETTGELEARLARLGAAECLEAVLQLEQGDFLGTPQDASLVTRAPKLAKEHGLIDWTQSAEQVQRHIRAMQPWPTAYTFFHRPSKPSIRLVLCKSEVVLAVPAELSESPGAVLSGRGKDEFCVRCGTDSVLSVLELTPAGKQRMPAAAFLRGYPIHPGSTLGSDGPA